MKNLMKLSVVLVAAALVFSSCNCFKKMAKNRDERYRNMEEVMGDLKAVRGGGPPLLARQKWHERCNDNASGGCTKGTHLHR